MRLKSGENLAEGILIRLNHLWGVMLLFEELGKITEGKPLILGRSHIFDVMTLKKDFTAK